MKKKAFFWLFATIVAMTLLVSCEKDEYLAAEPQPCFFKIVDGSHINLFDQQQILCEENREVEFKISPQLTQNIIGYEPLAPLDGENMKHNISYMADDGQIMSDGSYVTSFKYNNDIENKLRVFGLFIIVTNALGEKVNVFCLDEVTLRGEIETIQLREKPFLHVAQVHYSLLKDSIVLAEAVQDFRIVEDVNDIEY